MTDLHTPAQTLGGRYRLGPLLGRGGSADVYRGSDLTLGREVAVKVLRDAGDEALARHRGEISTLARLNHPGLVALYDAGSDADRAWFVMECVVGQTLGENLRGGPLPGPEVARIGTVLAETLAYVHAQGVVHRDLKPGNVLLGAGGTVKLTDFGIALVAGEARVTRTGLAVGTAAYIAPEQVEGRATSDRVDVYSLGLLLLEALTGRRAYEGSTVESALARLHRQPELPEHLSPGWQRLLTAMTARDPDERPSAADVLPLLAGLDAAPTYDPASAADPGLTQVLPVAGAATREPVTSDMPVMTTPATETAERHPRTAVLRSPVPAEEAAPTPWFRRRLILGLPRELAYVLAGIAVLVMLGLLGQLVRGAGEPAAPAVGTEATPTGAPAAPAEGDPDAVEDDLDRLDELVQP